MTLTEDEVVQILKLMEQSTFDELQLEIGDLKLILRKHGSGDAFAGHPAPQAGLVGVHAATQREAKAKTIEPGATKGGTAETSGTEGLIPIKAPLAGHRLPATGSRVPSLRGKRFLCKGRRYGLPHRGDEGLHCRQSGGARTYHRGARRDERDG